MSASIPGKNKGDPRVPVEEAEDKDLNYWRNRISDELSTGQSGAFTERNRQVLVGIEAEIARRASGGTVAQRSSDPERSIAKIGDGGLLKTAADAMKKIKELQGSCHLVNSPAVGCGIPDGCAVAWSVTYVNIDRDTYPVKEGGKLGVGKDALNMISMGMGLQWDPILSRRLDDGSEPLYCRYIAVGKMRDSDGTWITVFDEKENDLRDRSAQSSGMSEKQLAQQRSNIWSLTVTKARNRAIRNRGVKTSYSRDELEKPFVSFKLVFTGESSDPEIRRMKARSMLESTNLMYGNAPAQLPGLLLRPPPVDTTGHDVDDDELEPNGSPATGTGDY